MVAGAAIPVTMHVDASDTMRISAGSIRNGGSTINLSHPIYDRKSRKIIARTLKKSFRQFQDSNELLMLGNEPIETYVFLSGSKWQIS